MELVVLALLLLLSAFFSGSEIAFVSANRLRAAMAARRGGFAGRLVQRFLETPGMLLTTTLVGNNLALIVYSTVMAFYLEPAFATFFSEVLGQETGLEASVLTAQTLVASVMVLFLGEIIPKTIMREHADRLVAFLALPLRITYYVLLPLIWMASAASNMLMRLVRTDAASLSQYLRQDVELLIQETTEGGTLDLDEEESTILSNVFAMSTMRVKESMVPRTDIEAIECSTTLEDVRNCFIESGHSKLPVFEDNIDHIVGVAFAHNFFQQPSSLQDLMRDVRFVPEIKASKTLLQEFLSSNSSIAIVIDEYGGTAGLITREDLLEELFGDIQDEFDREDDQLRRVGPSTFLVSGSTPLDTFTEETEIHLPDGEYETVAGYLLERVGRIPETKEQFSFDNCHFAIERATSYRIDLVRVRSDSITQGTA
ncbi:MAG: DUF21 domain-containing protein [Bacteroidetes bacterium]|jgi:CBS domain containing-hemolysin-like protein|nr:DUF21 domain-containing protein [Bacteroidota bacterium]